MLAALRLTVLCLAAATTGCAAFTDCNMPCKSPCGPDGGLQARLDKAERQNAELLSQNADLTSNSVDLTGENNGLEKRNAALAALGKDRKAQYDLLTGQLDQEIAAGKLKVIPYRNMVTLEISDEILFDTAKAELRPEGKSLLLKMGMIFSRTDKIIDVIGHTDDVKMAPGAEFDNNWDLSTARAVTVVRFLHFQANVDPTHLMASGRGKWMPLVPNDSPENRQKNRRIEISLIDRGLVEGLKFNP
jgi:chemotaxis protein MotB